MYFHQNLSECFIEIKRAGEKGRAIFHNFFTPKVLAKMKQRYETVCYEMDCQCYGQNGNLIWPRNLYDHCNDHIIESRRSNNRGTGYIWKCDICVEKWAEELNIDEFYTENAFVTHLFKHVIHIVRCLKCGCEIWPGYDCHNEEYKYSHSCDQHDRSPRFPLLWYKKKHLRKTVKKPQDLSIFPKLSERISRAYFYDMSADFYEYFFKPEFKCVLKANDLVLYHFYTSTVTIHNYVIVWPHELIDQMTFFLNESKNRDNEAFKCITCDIVQDCERDFITHFSSHVTQVIRCRKCGHLSSSSQPSRTLHATVHHCTPCEPHPYFERIWHNDYDIYHVQVEKERVT